MDPGDRDVGRAPGRGHGFYVVEPTGEAGGSGTQSGSTLRRRRCGYPARLVVEDHSDAALPLATLLRVGAAAGFALEDLGDGLDRPLTLWLGPAGTNAEVRIEGDVELVCLDGPALAASPTRHPVEEQVSQLLAPGAGRRHPLPQPTFAGEPNAALFFESVMSSELPHNDVEISQGVLHLVTSLRGSSTAAVLVDVKMPAGDPSLPPAGLDRLAETLAREPVQLICLTLLEDYFLGASALLIRLRELGCLAHVAVGGVMPSLTPEHVAAHLPEVSFVCRGAGERFVPSLAGIVGTTDITEPFTKEQRVALQAMDGLFAIDRAGRRLIAGNPRHLAQVADLDAVELDLSHLQPRHIEGGIEISTARGCDHHCSFCTILGRQSYQARSAAGVLRLLDTYRARYGELFGSQVPRNAYRVHISDDDFACDRARAAEIFQTILGTPFRLSSVQLSIADLCRRDQGRLLVELDEELCDALRPECFADYRAAIPRAERLFDYRPRRWSSFLQIGVESFCDHELSRLAKGYRVAHIRLAVAALCAQGIHLDAYVILSNCETSAEDLLDSLEEIARLKLRHPVHFHLRYPAVKQLVSYYPSASHQVKLRQGKTDGLRVRRRASCAGHPEFDYPFVAADVAADPWVRAAVAESFLIDERRYTASLERLRALWLEQLATCTDAAERSRGERLIRRLDDSPRRLVFEQLSQARRASRGSEPTAEPGDEHVALEAATELLGPKELWLPAYRRYERDERPRLVVIPTWQCELRCRYCYIAKQDGRVMSRRTMERSVDLLLSCCRSDVLLQFFGGEPLVEWELCQHGIQYATDQAKRSGHSLSFIVSTNGWSLDEGKLAWLADHPVRFELSLDGEPETQNQYRHAAQKRQDSYVTGIASRVDAIHEAGLPYDVIMVVHPDNVGRLPQSFFHIADLGFRRIQVNFGLGAHWGEQHQTSFADGLHQIGTELRRRWSAGQQLSMVNLENDPLPMRLNGEITVDHDGTIYGGNGFLHETEHKEKFAIGHLDDLASFDRYRLDSPGNETLLKWTYPPDITTNNLAVGRIMRSFVRWMRAGGLGPVGDQVPSKST